MDFKGCTILFKDFLKQKCAAQHPPTHTIAQVNACKKQKSDDTSSDVTVEDHYYQTKQTNPDGVAHNQYDVGHFRASHSEKVVTGRYLVHTISWCLFLSLSFFCCSRLGKSNGIHTEPTTHWSTWESRLVLPARPSVLCTLEIIWMAAIILSHCLWERAFM